MSELLTGLVVFIVTFFWMAHAISNYYLIKKEEVEKKNYIILGKAIWKKWKE